MAGLAGRILAVFREKEKKGATRGISYRQLGIEQENAEHGRLILTQHSPKTGEVFVLREQEDAGLASVMVPKPAARGRVVRIGARKGMRTVKLPPETFETRRTNKLHVLRWKNGAEELVGYAEYAPMEHSTFVKDLETVFGHRKRDVASSMLAYMKTRGKDIWLVAGLGSTPFYRKLGFAKSDKYNRMLALPAEKPLALRKGEKKTRRFVITPPNKAVKK